MLLLVIETLKSQLKSLPSARRPIASRRDSPEAGNVDIADFKHTLPGLAINAGASVFWAAVYERLFGDEDERRRTG